MYLGTYPMLNLNTIFSVIKKPLPWIRTHKLWSAGIAIVLVVLVVSIAGRGESALAEKTTKAQVGAVLQEVSVTGRVKSAQAVDLSFERSGRATWIPVTVGKKVYQGQTLVQLDAGELLAQRQQALAGVAAAKARYEQVLAGARQEDIHILETALDAAVTQGANTAHTAISSAVSTLIALTDVQYAYFSDLSSEAINLASAKEQALFTLYGQENLGRAEAWYFVPLTSGLKGRIDRLSPTDGIDAVRASLDELRSAFDRILTALRMAQGALYGNSVSEADKTKLQGAIDQVLGQQQALSTANGSTRDAQARLELKIASPDSYEVVAAKSQWDQAEASLALVEAQLAKFTLRAPFSGTVTRVDITRGEVVAPSAPAVSLIGGGVFEIEANISEADVANVKVGNTAKVTFDAYGQGSVFSARVVHLDPAGTIVEGIAVYRVTLQFLEQDERILAGLTANVDLQTAQKEKALFVPSRDVITRNGKKYVHVLVPADTEDSRFATLSAVVQNETQKVVELEVTTGLRGSDGRTEVLTGIQAGDVIVGQ